MKPTLNKYLMAFLAGVITFAGTASGDYSGGQISNHEDSTPGLPDYTGQIIIDYNSDNDVATGGVQLIREEGQGKTTTLEGNIHIIAGQDYANSSEDRRNHGVFMSKEPATDDYHSTGGYNGNIILKTANASDQIKIDVYGTNSAGVWVVEKDSKIVLDASNSSQPIEINLHHEGENASYSRGIGADYGTVEVRGDLNINMAGGGPASGGSSGLTTWDGGTLSVTGDTIITGTGTYSRGVRSAGGSIALAGNLTTTTTSHGIYSYAILNRIGEMVAGSVSVQGDVNINVASQGSDCGIYSDNVSDDGTATRVEILGNTNIDVKGSQVSGMYARRGAGIEVRDTIIKTQHYGCTVVTGGNIKVDGSLEIDGTSGGSRGINIFNENSLLHITGTTDIKTDMSNGSIGVFASDKGSVILDGPASIEAGNTGLYVESGASIEVKSDIYIRATERGVRTNTGNSHITLNGAKRIESTIALWALGTSRIKANTGHYTILGRVETGGAGAQIDLAMTSQSYLEGTSDFTGNDLDAQTINISLSQNSQWFVTGNSTLTTLSLDNTSMLSFALLDSENMVFSNITATSVSLAQGATLMLLGISSSDFDSVMSQSLNQFTVNLFSGGLNDDGARLVTEDKYILDYTANGDGTYTINGVTDIQIPEPATATLGLLALTSLLVRRKKQ